MKKVLKQPWFWVLLLDFAYLFLLPPLLNQPGILYPFLPETWFDRWEEFAVMHQRRILATGALLLVLAALGNMIFLLFSGSVYGRNKVGIFMLGLLLCLFSIAVGMPTHGHAHPRARYSSCLNHMKQIRLSLTQYYIDFDGNYPPDLQTLSRMQYLQEREIFRCPLRTRPNPEWSDYLYFGSGHHESDPPFPLLRDQEKNHPGNDKNVMDSAGNISDTRS